MFKKFQLNQMEEVLKTSIPDVKRWKGRKLEIS